MIEAIGIAIYAACTDFIIHAANLFGVTYRDANAILFFLLWPAVTVGLVLVVGVQQVALVREGKRRQAGNVDRKV